MLVKKIKMHIGESLKRLRSYRGMTQAELAVSIGKTRSLISFFERTGNINKYTLHEIAAALNTTPEQLEMMDYTQNNLINENDVDPINHDALLKLIEQQNKEILFLKETINKQWSLIENLSKGKKTPPSYKRR